MRIPTFTATLLLISCGGPVGPQGPTGPTGPTGPASEASRPDIYCNHVVGQPTQAPPPYESVQIAESAACNGVWDTPVSGSCFGGNGPPSVNVGLVGSGDMMSLDANYLALTGTGLTDSLWTWQCSWDIVRLSALVEGWDAISEHDH